jgi:isopenicillin-N N-acyltransferase-like protein
VAATDFTSSILSPHERGVEFGERFATQVAAGVATYRRLFVARAGGPFDVDLWSERAWEAIRRLAPDHAAEIAGIAEGAGLRAEQVASVNARTEILAAANPTGLTECSAVVALPPHGAPAAAQTWDWYDAMSAGWLTWTIPHPDGRVVRTVTEFGMLAKVGVNDRGVGVLLTMLHHRNDAEAVATGEIGHPVHLLSRAVLDDAASADEAVKIASSARTSASTSLTVVDERGGAASVELFPGGPGVVEPTGGLLVRTNHFLSEDGRDGCLAATLGPSTRLRRRHLLAALGGRPGTAGEVVAAMRHHDPDGGVCRHQLDDPDPAQWHRTLATIVLDVAGRRLQATEHGPCGSRTAVGAG